MFILQIFENFCVFIFISKMLTVVEADDNEKTFNYEKFFGLQNQVTKEESCVCGLLGPPPKKVVGGIETKQNEYPWMAALMYNGRVRCGATLVNDRFVVTAAHCVRNVAPRFMMIYLGSHNLSLSYEDERQKFQVSNVQIHPNYDSSNHMNDIALLELSTAVQLTPHISTACLPTDSDANYDGKMALVTGWGRTEEGGVTSTVLRKVDVPIIKHSVCQVNYGHFDIDRDRMICAGAPKGGKDACQGDSGGPLVIDINGHHTLIGVVSFGEGCARPQRPGVYARVPHYLEFIVTNSKGAMFCPAYKQAKRPSRPKPAVRPPKRPSRRPVLRPRPPRRFQDNGINN